MVARAGDKMYPFLRVLQDERYETWFKWCEDYKTQIQQAINIPLGTSRELLLHCAVAINNKQIVTTLLLMKADPNLINSNGYSATEIAATDVVIKYSICMLLQYNGGRIHQQTTDKETHLHACVREACFSCRYATKLRHYVLIMGGGSEMHVKPTNSLNETPLALAVRLGSPTVVQFLLNHGARIDRDLCEYDVPSEAVTRARTQDFVWGFTTPFLKPLVDQILDARRLVEAFSV